MDYFNLYQNCLSEAFNSEKNSVKDLKVQKQIKLDVQRSFPQFKISMDEGENSLYNVLAAYAKHAPEVGYT